MMGYKNIVWFLLLFFLQVFIFSCSLKVGKELHAGKQVKIIDMEIDKLSNIYLLDNSQNLTLTGRYKKDKYTYSNSRFGNIATIDVTNPQKILLFFKDQQTLIILDNTLAEISRIELDPNSYYTAVGMANDGNIWLFDSYNNKLVKIDKSGHQIDESFPVDINNPGNKIVERENYVLIPDKSDNVYLFTNLGYFIKKIHLEGVVKPFMRKSKIYYYNKNDYKYSSYDLKYGEANIEYDFLNIKPQLAIYNNKSFYLLKNNKLMIIPLQHER